MLGLTIFKHVWKPENTVQLHACCDKLEAQDKSQNKGPF